MFCSALMLIANKLAVFHIPVCCSVNRKTRGVFSMVKAGIFKEMHIRLYKNFFYRCQRLFFCANWRAPRLWLESVAGFAQTLSDGLTDCSVFVHPILHPMDNSRIWGVLHDITISLGYANVDALTIEKLKKFFLVPLAFLATVFANIKILQVYHCPECSLFYEDHFQPRDIICGMDVHHAISLAGSMCKCLIVVLLHF